MNTRPKLNRFRCRTKLLIGLPAALIVGAGLTFDPLYYTRVVAIMTMVVALAFPLLYTTLPWKDSLLGRALMTHAQAVALLYLFTITNFWFEYPLKDYARALVATYLAIGITFQFVVLVRIKAQAANRCQETELLT